MIKPKDLQQGESRIVRTSEGPITIHRLPDKFLKDPNRPYGTVAAVTLQDGHEIFVGIDDSPSQDRARRVTRRIMREWKNMPRYTD